MSITIQESNDTTTDASEQSRAAAVSLAPPSLLLVEDDDDIAALTAEVLIDEGYTVTRAASRHDALALFATRGPCAYRLVLSDAFAYDRAQAYTWFDHLRTVTMAPIVIWSAAPRAYYEDCLARGYAGFLPKPFDLRDLILLMAALVPEPADAS